MSPFNVLTVLALLLGPATSTKTPLSASDPWGEHIQPRLRVNYLSQKSGKTKL